LGLESDGFGKRRLSVLRSPGAQEPGDPAHDVENVGGYRQVTTHRGVRFFEYEEEQEQDSRFKQKLREPENDNARYNGENGLEVL
jgi:hypothetical protein